MHKHVVDCDYISLLFQLTWKVMSPGPGHKCIATFPLENLPRDQHLIDPDIQYRVYDKTLIPEIECPQPDVIGMFNAPSERLYECKIGENGQPVNILSGEGIREMLPCVVKSSHSDAGNGTFITHNMNEYCAAIKTIRLLEPTSNILVTEMVDNIKHNYCCQLYISKSGQMKFIAAANQIIDQCNFVGAVVDMRPDVQHDLIDLLTPCLIPVKEKLHHMGYFGCLSVDVLIDEAGGQYVIDLNPRAGSALHLVSLAPVMTKKGWTHGIFISDILYEGSFSQLIRHINGCADGEVFVFAQMPKSDNLSIVQAAVFSSNIKYCVEIIKHYFPVNNINAYTSNLPLV